jgi:mannose-1-phosphate guanylyltransferase
MSLLNDLYCVILAGGKGRRLWPVSREDKPKQFIDFFGTGRTQLQQAYDRFLKILPVDHIYVCTNRIYADITREQLPDLPNDNILVEPIYRSTAPSVAWAAHRIYNLCHEARIIVTPTDQTVQNEKAFYTNIDEALTFIAQKECVLAMGVAPTRPEPGYGYIQVGDVVGRDVFDVKSFTEKPERNFAKMFIESGEFLWNTGMFASTAEHFYNVLSKLWQPVLKDLDKMNAEFSVESENKYIEENFSRYPNMSLDVGLFEKTNDIYVLRSDFGWADLGTWHSMYEARQRVSGENVAVGTDAYFDGSRNNIVKIPKGKLAVVSGLDGYIVAEEGNVLLICKKEDSSALIKKYVNEIQMKRGDEYV